MTNDEALTILPDRWHAVYQEMLKLLNEHFSERPQTVLCEWAYYATIRALVDEIKHGLEASGYPRPSEYRYGDERDEAIELCNRLAKGIEPR